MVAVNFGEARLIGFVTREDNNSQTRQSGLDNLVSVYLPMSYQIGGFTVYVSRDKLEPLDISVEEAMQMVLTAGLTKQKDSVKQ